MKKIMFSVLAILSLASFAQAEIIKGEATFAFPNLRPNAENWPKMPWVGLNLETKTLVNDPAFAAPGWQIRGKSGYFSSNGGAVAESMRKFDEIKEVPSDLTYTADETKEPKGEAPKDTYNFIFADWKRYIFACTEGASGSHLTAINPHHPVFIVRSFDQHWMKIEFIDSIKELIRAEVKMGPFGRCSNIGPEEIKKRQLEADKFYVTIRYSYNTSPGDQRLE